MDIPYAIQKVLQADAGVQAAVRQGYSWPATGANGVFLLELDEVMDLVMPIELVVVRATGGPGGYQTLQLNDQSVSLFSYGATQHLGWNLDSAIYTALKGLRPSIWAQTYLHYAYPSLRGNALRDPTTQWPYVLSVWQVRASDLTIAA